MSGYSKNPLTAEKMLPLLGPIIAGQLCTWETEVGQADHLAYKIREALYIARLYRDRWSAGALHATAQNPDELWKAEALLSISRMAERVRIVVTSPSTVEARLQKGVPEAMVLTGGGAPMQGYENPGRSVVTITKQTVWSIQEAWRAQQPSNTPLHFPNASLSYDELVQLHAWAEPLGLLLFVVDGALTVQRKSLDLVEYAWQPRAAVEDVPAEDFPFKD